MNVSIVIPLYNKAEHIRRALDSVFAQTRQDFELIVVDDGSTDDGSEKVRRYADPRIRLISQENAGVSAARNRGIAEAKAEWIALLDADDQWLPTYLDRALTFAGQHPEAGVVVTNFLQKTSGKIYTPPHIAREGVLEDFFDTALRLGHCPAFASATIARRQAYLEIGGFPVGVAHGEDVDTWNRLACRNRIGFIAEPLVIYNDDVAGASQICARGLPLSLHHSDPERSLGCAHSTTSAGQRLRVSEHRSLRLHQQSTGGRARVGSTAGSPAGMSPHAADLEEIFVCVARCLTPHWLRLIRRRFRSESTLL